MAKQKYAGRYARGNVQPHKTGRYGRFLVPVSIALLLSAVVGGSLAYIIARTDDVQNRFVPGSVTCQVNAQQNGSVDVTNTGNVDAYIRAAVAVNWMDDQGNVRGLAPTAAEYALVINSTDWHMDPDTGFYYYEAAVSPSETTKDLVESLTAAEPAPEGYRLSVEVVAEAIQAAGVTDDGGIPAYRDAWGIASVSG